MKDHLATKSDHDTNLKDRDIKWPGFHMTYGFSGVHPHCDTNHTLPTSSVTFWRHSQANIWGNYSNYSVGR